MCTEEQKVGATFVFMGYLGCAYSALGTFEDEPFLAVTAEEILIIVSLAEERVWGA